MSASMLAIFKKRAAPRKSHHLQHQSSQPSLIAWQVYLTTLLFARDCLASLPEEE